MLLSLKSFSSDWTGRDQFLLCGDWNQEPHECLVATLATMYGCVTAESFESSSKWKGHRLIDFFISNIPHLKFRALEAKISENKIMETFVKLELNSFNVHRFKKGSNFEKPMWLGAKDWELLFHQVHDIEKATNWQHACNLADDGAQIPSQFDDEDHDQKIVDFTWRLTICKALTIFQTAYKLAILCIPDHFDNKWEIRRVEKLANKIQKSRLSVEKHSWDQQSPQFRTSMARRKHRNKLNLAQELVILLRKGKFNHVSFCLMRRLYGKHVESFDFVTLQKFVRNKYSNWKQKIENVHLGNGGGKLLLIPPIGQTGSTRRKSAILKFNIRIEVYIQAYCSRAHPGV